MKGAELVKNLNVMLTVRDIEILESLYSNCVMTYSQIASRHFPNVAKPTVINRLSKLESAGFIRRERIPRMELGRDKNAVGVVFQVTRTGIVELRQRQLGKEFKPQPIKFHPYTLHHDLILVDLSDAIKKRFGNCTLTNGKLLRGIGQPDSALEPDLVVAFPIGPAKVAIELELSDKSERRYREIVLRYRLSREYTRVIYFVDEPFIQNLLTRVILNRNPYAHENPNTGRFYFSRANEFLTNPTLSPISNGVEDLKGGL